MREMEREFHNFDGQKNVTTQPKHQENVKTSTRAKPSTPRYRSFQEVSLAIQDSPLTLGIAVKVLKPRTTRKNLIFESSTYLLPQIKKQHLQHATNCNNYLYGLLSSKMTCLGTTYRHLTANEVVRQTKIRKYAQM